jgi:hypothetical protein
VKRSLTLLLLGVVPCALADAPIVVGTDVLGSFTGHDASLHPDSIEPVTASSCCALASSPEAAGTIQLDI